MNGIRSYSLERNEGFQKKNILISVTRILKVLMAIILCNLCTQLCCL